MRIRLMLAAAAIGWLARPAPIHAQCDDWRPGPFSAHTEGLNGQVFASTLWSPAGFGGSMVVVGGTFTSAGELPVGNIAAWDGASWRALGSGIAGSVYGVTVYNGEVIAAGQFQTAGGAPASNIARWDGQAWHALGSGLNGNCQGVGVYNGELIAGGTFTDAGGAAVSNIARWNGTSWSAMGSGMNGVVTVFQVYNGNLIAGGGFTTAGGNTANHIASWNGSAWSGLTGGGLNSGCASLAIFNGELVAGGGFTVAGSVSAKRIAHWNGSTWAAFGAGFNNPVDALAVYNGVLIAGGVFTDAIGAGDYLASWNGATWNSFGGVGTPVPFGTPAVWAMTVFGNDLIVGGYFGSAGGVPCGYVAKWNNVNFSTLQVAPPWVLAFTAFGGRMVAGGTFIQSTSTSTPAYNLAAFDGASVTKFDAGVNAAVRAMVGYSDNFGLHNSHLIVGGDFTTAGGISPANRVAMWTVSDAIVQSGWSALGSGFDGSVRALERFNNATYAGGDFIFSGATAVNRVAQLSGGNWISMAGGMNGSVLALKVYNGSLYAGGSFTTAGGSSTGGLARWTGSSWVSVGGFFNGTVKALEVHNGELVIGGNFVGLPNGTNIAKYNSATGIYTNLGSGGANGDVLSLKSDGGSVYVGGAFTQIGGVSALRIAKWNSTNGWSDVRGGADSSIYALGALHGEIDAGGLISSVGSSPIFSPGWARYAEAGAPWFAQHPSTQTDNCGQNAVFNVTVASGYSGLTYSWRRNAVPLVNGPTVSGSIITGATGPSLTLANISSDDVGSYDCVVTNSCGSATSFAASLSVIHCRDCVADFNGNAVVDIDDLLTVIGEWGACPGCPGDIVPAGGNGMVDIDDLLAVIGGWGPCP